jgi:hypothetical protein
VHCCRLARLKSRPAFIPSRLVHLAPSLLLTLSSLASLLYFLTPSTSASVHSYRSVRSLSDPRPLRSASIAPLPQPRTPYKTYACQIPSRCPNLSSIAILLTVLAHLVSVFGCLSPIRTCLCLFARASGIQIALYWSPPRGGFL